MADRRRPIDVEISEEPLAELGGYATITIAFEVCQVLDVSGSEGAWTLSEREIEQPYIKEGLRGNEWAKSEIFPGVQTAIFIGELQA